MPWTLLADSPLSRSFWRGAGRMTAPMSSRLKRILVKAFASSFASRRTMAKRARALVAANAPQNLLSYRRWLPAETRRHVEELRRQAPGEPFTLGRIDNDGRLLTPYGDLPGLDSVDPEAFVERYRYGLDLVLVGDAVLVRKDYRGDRDAFLREWLSLAVLGETSCTPSVHHVDEQRLLLFKSYVPGATLRQRLVESGARILSVQTDGDPDLTGLSALERIEAVWTRGRELLGKATRPDFLDDLKHRLERVHRRGVTGFSLTFGNIVLHEDDARPWFIDFDSARTHRRPRGFLFTHARERHREIFSRIYSPC